MGAGLESEPGAARKAIQGSHIHSLVELQPLRREDHVALGEALLAVLLDGMTGAESVWITDSRKVRKITTITVHVLDLPECA